MRIQLIISALGVLCLAATLPPLPTVKQAVATQSPKASGEAAGQPNKVMSKALLPAQLTQRFVTWSYGFTNSVVTFNIYLAPSPGAAFVKVANVSTNLWPIPTTGMGFVAVKAMNAQGVESAWATK